MCCFHLLLKTVRIDFVILCAFNTFSVAGFSAPVVVTQGWQAHAEGLMAGRAASITVCLMCQVWKAVIYLHIDRLLIELCHLLSRQSWGSWHDSALLRVVVTCTSEPCPPRPSSPSPPSSLVMFGRNFTATETSNNFCCLSSLMPEWVKVLNGLKGLD